MTEVIRVRCPHRTWSFTTGPDDNDWSTVVTEVQIARDDDTGDFVEFRYPVRCEPCGPAPGRPLVADMNQDTMNERFEVLRELQDPSGTRNVVEIPLALLALALGSEWPRFIAERDKRRHAPA